MLLRRLPQDSRIAAALFALDHYRRCARHPPTLLRQNKAIARGNVPARQHAPSERGDIAECSMKPMSSHDITRATSTRMVNQNWWITTLMINGHKYCPPLTRDIECDVLIVGGGFSGISAAAEFLARDCASCSSRRTSSAAAHRAAAPASSLPTASSSCINWFAAMARQAAAEIWEAPCRGIDRIVGTAEEARHSMRTDASGFAVSRTRRRRRGGRRVRARVPRKRRLHRSAHLRRESAAADSRRRRATPRVSATAARMESIRWSACRD